MTLYDTAGGASRAASSLLGRYQAVQWNDVFAETGAPPRESASAIVEVLDGGAVIAHAIRVDNRTNDAQLPPRPRPQAAAGPLRPPPADELEPVEVARPPRTRRGRRRAPPREKSPATSAPSHGSTTAPLVIPRTATASRSWSRVEGPLPSRPAAARQGDEPPARRSREATSAHEAGARRTAERGRGRPRSPPGRSPSPRRPRSRRRETPAAATPRPRPGPAPPSARPGPTPRYVPA